MFLCCFQNIINSILNSRKWFYTYLHIMSKAGRTPIDFNGFENFLPPSPSMTYISNSPVNGERVHQTELNVGKLDALV